MVYGSILVLKKLKTVEETVKYHRDYAKICNKRIVNSSKIPTTNREGGRTVGSGRVATVIE